MNQLSPTPLTVQRASVRSTDLLGVLPRTGRVLARFSCGAPSAVATKMAIQKYGAAVEIYYNDTGSEHPDNARFLRDCEQWLGRKIRILRSEKYADVDAVIEGKRFLVSPEGAACTAELKRIPGDSVWQIGDVEIYGYTVEEQHRVVRWQRNNPERIIECPLIDKLLSKEDCLGMIQRVGIALPAMYLLGFNFNNCIACVKARDNINYWRRVRKHFPVQFARRASQERMLGLAINRVTKNGVRSEMYLDEIPPGDPTGPDTAKISCGLFCMAEADELSTPNVQDQPHRKSTNQGES